MKRFLEVTPPTGPAYPVFVDSSQAGAARPSASAMESRGAIAEQLVHSWNASWRRAVLIADDTTHALFAGPIARALEAHSVPVASCVFPPGEHHKTRATKVLIEDRMLAEGIDKSACIVAVGGGIVLDVAGFVAATYMRGLPHINVATTLLAQVDAAIGGKTAVNTEHGKNLIGAVHHPRAVLLDTHALVHLPDAELRSGLAEAIKHAVLSDAGLFAELETWATSRSNLIPPLPILERCVAIKASVVAADDRDRGKRNILNYGHTAAHVIELATDHATAHGQAVAMGMVIEARLATQAGQFPAADLERLVALLEAFALPVEPSCSFDAARAFLPRDKKSVAGSIGCAIPRAIGTTLPEDDESWVRTVTAEQLRKAWSP